MTADLTRVPLEIEVLTGSETRLLIKTWDAPTGRSFIQIVPEYLIEMASGSWPAARRTCPSPWPPPWPPPWSPSEGGGVGEPSPAPMDPGMDRPPTPPPRCLPGVRVELKTDANGRVRWLRWDQGRRAARGWADSIDQAHADAQAAEPEPTHRVPDTAGPDGRPPEWVLYRGLPDTGGCCSRRKRQEDS